MHGCKRAVFRQPYVCTYVYYMYIYELYTYICVYQYVYIQYYTSVEYIEMVMILLYIYQGRRYGEKVPLIVFSAHISRRFQWFCTKYTLQVKVLVVTMQMSESFYYVLYKKRNAQNALWSNRNIFYGIIERSTTYLLYHKGRYNLMKRRKGKLTFQ